MLGSPILYLKGMRIMMFQLSGFRYRLSRVGKLGALGFEAWGLGQVLRRSLRRFARV